MTVRLPPLRERGDDVVPLAEAFLQQCARDANMPPPTVSPALAAALRARSWPGNVRQLKNEMVRAWALAGGGEIRPELLTPPDPEVAASDAVGLPPGHDLVAIERWAIERALAAAQGNKAEAARLLGIGRRTLYDKLGPAAGGPPAS
ncbi:MAG: hypothetical protein JNK15_02060 [Planctomycetes bacterium]|nr:hypothetical protein [Planctomycetota bacterium]